MKKAIMFFMIFSLFQGSFSFETKENLISSEDKYAMIEGKLPVFYSSGKLMRDSTDRIKTKFITLMEVVQKEAKRNFAERERESYSKFILKSDFEKIKNNCGYDSYLVKTFYYIGGKHGMISEEGVNFRKGKNVSLKDIFKDEINYRGLIEQKIEEQIARSEGDIYYSDVKIPEEGYGFYFKGDSLVVIFNPYTIASHEAGIINFEIPISEISDFLNDAN